MDNRAFIIRKAVPSDAELIADMSRSTFYDTFAADNTAENMQIFLEEQFTRNSLVEEVFISSNTFLLAYYGEEPAGYVKLRKQASPRGLEGMTVLEIARIYVVKDFLGKGVGNSLMEYVVNLALEWQVDALWLAVWEHNARAIRFYERCGFTTFDQQVFLLGRDMQKNWRMVKKL